MAKIPIILEPGRADGKLATSGAIFDENKGMFQSELNDIQDTLNSDNANKPLSAKQGKVLKELLDSKVIEAGAVPIDSEPIEGNITHVVNSDGLAKEFNKCNTAIINTNRIEDGSVTSEKIATSAFDSTLSLSGKIATADVVGEKLTELKSEINGNDGIIYDGEATKLDVIFDKNKVVGGSIIDVYLRESTPYLIFYSADGSELSSVKKTSKNIVVPPAYDKAILDYGASGTKNYIKIVDISKIRKGLISEISDIKEDVAKTPVLINTKVYGNIPESEYAKGDTVFTKHSVNVGDTIQANRLSGTNYLVLLGTEGNELFVAKKEKNTVVIPEGFDRAIIDYSTGKSTWTIINNDALAVKVANLSNTIEQKVSEYDDELFEDFELEFSQIGMCIQYNGKITAEEGYNTTELQDVENKKIFQYNCNYIQFYDSNKSPIGSRIDDFSHSNKWKELVIPKGARYVAFTENLSWGVTTIAKTPKKNIKSLDTRLTKAEFDIAELKEKVGSIVVDSDKYCVVSAKIELPEDSHDVEDLVEVMTIQVSDKMKFGFYLKKAIPETREDKVGTCPVPVYKAGIMAGYSYQKGNWIDGKAVNWQDGHIINSPNDKYFKVLATFDSVTINTKGTDVRICWYFDDSPTNVAWTRYNEPQSDVVFNKPNGAKYFAMSTQISDTDASCVFSSVAIEGALLSPDGWNKSLLLGSDAISLRYNGDVTNAANQDIRLKIDNAAITIYHSTTNDIIHSFSKAQCPNAETLYDALSGLENFDVEMLDVCGIAFDDFIKCDVALVSQYEIEKQDNPGTKFIEWDSFPFYFTTKEKGGTYNFEIGIDASATDKKIQAVINGYPVLSVNSVENFVGKKIDVTFGNEVIVHKSSINKNGEFYCPIRRMFYVEGVNDGNKNSTGGAAWTSKAHIEQAIDIMQRNNGHNVSYADLIKEVLGDYKTSGNQFTITSDDNGLPVYNNTNIRNMWARKGVTPSTFFLLDDISKIEPYTNVIKACMTVGFGIGVHSPAGYTRNINVGRLKYVELVDAVNKTFTTFVELFGSAPIIWDFHRDGEGYNQVRYIINHGYKFIMGGGYASDYGIVSTITRYRIQRFGIRPDTNGQNVRMPNDWLFKKY